LPLSNEEAREAVRQIDKLIEDVGIEVGALLSIMDVVEELAWQVEDKSWAAIVSNTFNKHRAEIRGERVRTTGQHPRRR
jgi:hypothetical protein